MDEHAPLPKTAAHAEALNLPGFVETVNEHAIIAITDPNGRFIYANDAFCKISKYNLDELTGEPCTIADLGQHPASFFQDIVETIQTGSIWRGRIKNRAKDGSCYWVDTVIKPIKNEAGVVTHLINLRADVTELVTAKEDLESIRQKESAIRRILAIALSDIRIERMLEGALEVLSLVSWLAPVTRSAVYLEDSDSRQMSPAVWRDLEPANANASQPACFGACICNQVASSRTIQATKCTLHQGAGTSAKIAQWDHIAIPLVGQAGLLGALVFTAPGGNQYIAEHDNFFTDVAKALSVGIEQKRTQDGLNTEREQVLKKQRELEEKSALMEAGFENMAEGLVALTPDLIILAANKRFSELLEVSPELIQHGSSFEPVLQHLSNVLVDKPYRAALSVDGMRAFVRDGANQPVKFIFNTGKTLAVQANPIPEVGAVFTVADVTLAQLTESRARQSHKLEALGELAGGVAHEYNNLLTSILGFARMALRKFNDQDRVRESLQEIVEASGRATDITQQMLTFSNKQVLAPIVVDIGETIRSMEPLLRVFVQANLEVRFDIRTQARASIDPALLTQCVSNLVMNSRQAMPDGGTITITCDAVAPSEYFATSHGDKLAPGRYVSITVSDTGRGIDSEVLTHIFDPFFTTREVGAGTGLGLSMVFGMAKNQGGAIHVESTPGEGATFTIYLPEVEVPLSQTTEEAVATPVATVSAEPPAEAEKLPQAEPAVVPTQADKEKLMRFI